MNFDFMYTLKQCILLIDQINCSPLVDLTNINLTVIPVNKDMEKLNQNEKGLHKIAGLAKEIITLSLHQ